MIQMIVELMSEDQKELLSISLGSGDEKQVIATAEDQLKDLYACYYGLFAGLQAKTKIARILERNRYNFHILREQQQLALELTNPDAFTDITEVNDSTTGDIETSGSFAKGNRKDGIGLNKSRQGGTEYDEDGEIEKTWDSSDQKFLNDGAAKNESISVEITDKQITQEAVKPYDITDNYPENPIYFNNLTISANRNIYIGKDSAAGSDNRTQNTNTRKQGRTKKFNRAKNIEAMQNFNIKDARSCILTSFAILFSAELPCL